MWAGKFYYAELRNGIDGPVVAKFDPLNDGGKIGDTSFTASTGETWTINQSGSPDAELAGTPDATTGYEVREAFDPYTRGSFAGKFIARNPYYANFRCRVREGYIGQALADMSLRNYIIDRIEGPSGGTWRVKAKDLFSKLEARKAVAPEASQGELDAGISAAATSATLSPAGIGDLDYTVVGSPGEFYVAIGDEIIRTQRSGDALNFVTRGALGTTAAAHDAEDLVQLVLGYETMLAQDIVYDLLTVYGGIAVAQIDQAEWDTLTAALTTLYTGHVAEPTPVAELVGELSQQAGFTVWHDVETDMIKIAVLRASGFSTVIDDDAWLKAGSLSVKRQDDRRVTQVWVYYGQRNRKADLEKRDNFTSRLVTADLNAEADEQYGVPKIREVFSRWIPQFGRQAATETGERILSLFRNPPLEAEFSLHHSRLSELSLAQFIGLRTRDIQDETGAIEDRTMALVEIERKEHEIVVKMQEVNFFTDQDESGDREIFIENDVNNINLRSLHDSLYGAPPEGSPTINVTFRILDGVTVGSTSTSNPALQTGAWSDYGIVPTLDINSGGRVQGKGGKGGNATELSAGSPGAVGGVALLADDPIIVTGAGEIWGGGGGGGGGGSANGSGGGGGGGGAGTDVGDGGSGADLATGTDGFNGSAGTSEVGGAGGAGGCTGAICGGGGGAGGGPGQAGTAGSANVDAPIRAGGSGGAAGAAISGVSKVSFTSPDELDIQGAQTG